MNANELRHNNYAYECYWCNETGIFKNTIIQIRDVLKSHVVDVFDNAYNYEDINPILLTEELLLKCGFKYDTLDWLYLRRKRFNFNTDRSVNMGVVYVNINNRDLGLEIKHLHELQNLYFALTQKELKVNL